LSVPAPTALPLRLTATVLLSGLMTTSMVVGSSVFSLHARSL